LIGSYAHAKKRARDPIWPKPQRRRAKLPATGNKRLADQIRKILGKHYANKYRVQ
jgi:hypothetical protein